jgi:uncharacterized surface protein with fasciclin (FAS1) repeats
MKLILVRSFILASFYVAISASSFSQAKLAAYASMSPSKNIAENVSTSKAHSTLGAAIKATSLINTLKSQGPYTVFAPTNIAFNKLPKGTMGILMKPENKEPLNNILNYHVIASRMPANDLITSIQKNGGSFKAKTIQGGELTFSIQGKHILVSDGKGGISKIIIKDVNQNNGILHVVDAVLMPNG